MRRIVATAAFAIGGQVLLGAFEPGELRAEHKEERALIDFVSERSPTFRQLADRLEQSSVVVYVRFGICRGHVDACLEYVSAAVGLIYVRATINQFNRPPATLSGLLAHELRHAVELADAGVATREGFKSFLARYGHQERAGYETDQAVATGHRVEREVVESASTKPHKVKPPPRL